MSFEIGQTKCSKSPPIQTVSILHGLVNGCAWVLQHAFQKENCYVNVGIFLPMLVNFYIFDKYLYVYEFFITNEEINSNIKSLKLITSSG